MTRWQELSQEQKIERLNRDLSIVWYAIAAAVGIGLGLLIDTLL